MDRTHLVPPHIGPFVLPNSPFFTKLLRHARRSRFAIRDVNLKVEKTYGDLLADSLALRSEIEWMLGDEVKQKLNRDKEVFVGVLAAGGYEFAVAVVAVLALGAAVVPMSVLVPVEEITYFVNKSKQVLLLSSVDAASLALATINAVGDHFKNVPILARLPPSPLCSPMEMSISSNRSPDDNSAGVVIFTSGTTGKPKGAVMRRSYTHETALAIGEGYDIDHNDILLHVLPVHHTTGLGTSFFAYLVAGACIEFRSGSFNSEWVWNRWLQGGITVFSGVPTIYMRLQWHFERTISKLSSAEVERYVEATNQLRALKCGSSALQPSVQAFWTKLRNGRPILTRYGATEYPGCIKVPAGMDSRTLPPDCVGMPVPGVELKLTEGDHGELLVKSPYMFAKYLDDDKATAEAHDEQGYFKTGDICHRKENLYFITGRASIDIIKTGGYKVSAIEVERACLELPYVNEAVIVGVEDVEYGQRVGAILSIRTSHGEVGRNLAIEQLRSDLKKKIASYKVPTVLRLVEGELPKGPTGKVQKTILRKELSPHPGWQNDDHIQIWGGKLSNEISRL